MSTHQIFSVLIVIATLVIQINYCFCMNSQNLTNIGTLSFGPAVATWYGDREGAGSTGGACGYRDDVTKAPYNSLVSAGGPSLFRSGEGCGACYQVKCTQNSACSGFPVIVTITDSCPGCTDAPIRFDLSGKAMGYLAKQGQGDALRSAGKINIEYQRVACNYNAKISFRIDNGANANYLSFEIEFVNGDGEISYAEVLPSGYSNYIGMQRVFGETWKADLPNGTKGPFSVRLTTTGRRSIFAQNVIPYNWAPGQYYTSNVNF